ncbi:uncharacterized protein LOC107304214 isoform X2 [Oryza brachyantha]|uniref:uncharacterized protein LOC107304214 isoform X2 n=1 Tax=Oryza brachyantha TaxID=4533 RepID=UPI001AD965B8|nr:uncharacterized protein LOC107304214 isoform X2 [Oryza brachyantha]
MGLPFVCAFGWSTPYLAREFFHRLGEKMGDKVMLIVAEHDDKLVAGALNRIGGDTLFGRLWGCMPDAYFPNLHFEACYYQAIQATMELNLSEVDAGAQGEHKIQHSYLPVTTYSCRYFLNPGFGIAIGHYLAHETAQMERFIARRSLSLRPFLLQHPLTVSTSFAPRCPSLSSSSSSTVPPSPMR